jgi:hypothetical protein
MKLNENLQKEVNKKFNTNIDKKLNKNINQKLNKKLHKTLLENTVNVLNFRFILSFILICSILLPLPQVINIGVPTVEAAESISSPTASLSTGRYFGAQRLN